MRGPLKYLGKGVAIYGAGDAAVMVVSFLLLPVYVKYNILTPADFGALGLIGAVEAFAKVINRWGLDGAFMRFYNDREAGHARQRMASTIVWFMVVVNGLLLAASLLGAPTIARMKAIEPGYLLALQLMLINMFLMSFTFVPFHVMRLQHPAATFSAFSLARSAGTIVLRIVLILWLRWGVVGVYSADVIVTVILLPLMWPWFRPLLRAVFSWGELRSVLRFGLPRLPHGLASQMLDGYPKLVLGDTFGKATTGIYQNGTTLSTGVSFFKNAFETAFAPFYYSTAREPNAKEVFSKMATYGTAVLVLIVAGTIAVAPDVIRLALNRSYMAALPVVPLVAIAYGLQGVYQLTSIGLNLTSKTEFYSASTLTAAGVSVVAGLWLIPRYGVTGAALTVLISYSTQVAIGTVLAHRFYPMAYEGGRLLRIVIAGIIAAAAPRWIAPATLRPIWGFLFSGSLTVILYGSVLWVSGFFRSTERAFLKEVLARVRDRRTAARAEPTDAK